jgi:hypothetical protein
MSPRAAKEAMAWRAADKSWINRRLVGRAKAMLDSRSRSVTCDKDDDHTVQTRIMFGPSIGFKNNAAKWIGFGPSAALGGGVSYGNRTVDATGFVGPFSAQGSFGGTTVGWDAGGGLAAKIGPSSGVFIESRWVDLDSVSAQLSLTIPGERFAASASQNFGFAIGQVVYSYHFWRRGAGRSPAEAVSTTFAITMKRWNQGYSKSSAWRNVRHFGGGVCRPFSAAVRRLCRCSVRTARDRIGAEFLEGGISIKRLVVGIAIDEGRWLIGHGFPQDRPHRLALGESSHDVKSTSLRGTASQLPNRCF